MLRKFSLLAVILILILVSASVLAKVSAPDWSNFYGVINIQRSGLYHFFELTAATMTGEERLGAVLNLNGNGMMLQKKYDFVFDGDQYYGSVEDADIGEVNPENKGERDYKFTVTPDSIKGAMKAKYAPMVTNFDLSLQDNKLTGTAMQKKKTYLKYDITFNDNKITGTIGVKGNMHNVDLQIKGNELVGTIKGTKRFGNGNYIMDMDFMMPEISREKLSFIFLVLIHQEFITDFLRNIDFDLPYHSHGSSGGDSST